MTKNEFADLDADKPVLREKRLRSQGWTPRNLVDNTAWDNRFFTATVIQHILNDDTYPGGGLFYKTVVFFALTQNHPHSYQRLERSQSIVTTMGNTISNDTRSTLSHRNLRTNASNHLVAGYSGERGLGNSPDLSS